MKIHLDSKGLKAMLEKIFQKQWKILTITYNGRSGSVFLSSLLDSHPNIMLIPGTYIYGFFRPLMEKEFISKKEISFIYSELFALFSDANHQITKDTDIGWTIGTTPGKELCFHQMGPNRDKKLGIDKEKFLKCFDTLLGSEDLISIKRLFLATHIAYQVSLGATLEEVCVNKSVIVYQLHTRDDVVIDTLTKDFGDIYQIQMVREPIQALGSHISAYKDTKSNIPAMCLFNSYCWTGNLSRRSPNTEEYNSNFYKAVKLEDLHINPLVTMKKICNWLSINFHDSLLRSTFDNLQWWNVRGSEVVSGSNQITISKKHKNIFSSLDKFRLRYLLRHKYLSWEYPISKFYFGVTCPLFVFIFLFFPYRFIKYKRDETKSYLAEHLYCMEFFLYYDMCTRRRKKNKNIIPLL